MIYILSKNVRDINHVIQNLLFIATENSKYMFLSFDIEWGFKRININVVIFSVFS